MKKALSILSLLTLIAVSLTVSVSASYLQKPAATVQLAAAASAPAVTPAQKARFTTMLNNNQLFGTDFESNTAMVKGAMVALADRTENDRLSCSLLTTFIANLYGRTVDLATAGFEVTDGTVAIVPQGYARLSHNILTATAVEGGFEVTSEMTVTPHDGPAYTQTVCAAFVENSGSAFGYNLVSATVTAGNAV